MEAVGLNIQLNGEQDFARSISNITAKSKELASELKLVSGAYGDNDQKMEVLNKQVKNQEDLIGELNKKYDAQAKNLEAIGAELEEAKATYGENSKEVLALQKQYDKAETSLTNTKTQINKAQTALNSMNKDLEDAQTETSGEAKEVDKLGDEMDEAGEKTGSFGEKLKNGFEAAGKVIAGVGAAAAAAVGSIWKMGQESAETADEIDKGAAKANVSRQVYQELDYVFGSNGADVGLLQNTMKGLTDKIQATTEAAEALYDAEDAIDYSAYEEAVALHGEQSEEAKAAKKAVQEQEKAYDAAAAALNKTRKSFDALGVSMEKSDGSMKTSEELMLEAITALEGMDDQEKKAALAVDIFGKAGTELLPMLNQSAGSFEKMREEAHELGLVLDDEVIDAGVNMGDAVDRVKRSMSALGANLGGAITPLITKLADYITAHLPQITKIVDQLAPIVTGLFENLMGPLMQIVDDVLPVFSGLISAILPELGSFISTLLPPLVSILAEVLPMIAQAAQIILPVLISCLQQILGPILTLVQNLLPLFSQFLSEVGPVLSDLIMTVLGVFVNILEQVFPFIQSLAEKLLPILSTVIQELGPLLQVVFEIVGEIFTILGPVLDLVFTLLEPLLDLIGKILPVLIKILTGVANVVKAVLTPIITVFRKIIEGVTWTVKNFGTGFKNVWTGLKTFFSGIGKWFKDKLGEIGGFFTKLWEGIKTGAKAGLNGVISFLNGMIDGVNAILWPMRKLIEVLGKVLGKNWSMDQIAIPQIPMLAKGGLLRYGTALVGEEGPELLSVMKGGAQVVPLSGGRSGEAAAEDNITLNIYGAEGQNVNQLAEVVMNKIQAATNRKRAAYGY